MHVQRAGLQRSTKHGVFHSPGKAAREGWRVALSARITKLDAEERVGRFCADGCYSEELGPAGDWGL